jgi:hypothetical protein
MRVLGFRVQVQSNSIDLTVDLVMMPSSQKSPSGPMFQMNVPTGGRYATSITTGSPAVRRWLPVTLKKPCRDTPKL